MVLGDLGTALTSALANLSRSASVDEESLKAFMNEIAAALIKSDVNVAMVKKLKTGVLAKVQPLLDADADGGGGGGGGGVAAHRARAVEKAVVEELVRILDPGREPYKLKKGKCNVIMFVGLQGAGKTTTVA